MSQLSSAIGPETTGDLAEVAARERRRNEPGDILQDQLLHLWQQLLGTPEMGIRDDFFSRGGSPALYERMLVEVEHLCGERLAPADVGEVVTIRDLSDVLVARLSHSPILEIQPGLAGVTPLVFLHGDVSGGGYYVRELARGLGAEQPVYAPQQSGMHGEELPESVEAMAAGHIRDLNLLRPEGPLHLGGHCCGAIIALEMVAQLTRAGRQIDMLLMVEPPVRVPGDKPHLPVVPHLSPEQRRLPRLRGPWLFARYCALLSHYQCSPYPGRVAVYFARDAREGRRPHDRPETRAALRAIVPNAEIFTSPGTHISVPGRHVRALAGAIKVYLSPSAPGCH